MGVRFCLYHPPGCEANTDAKVLKAKLALNWTGPYKILAVSPCSAAETPDGSPLGSNLLFFNIPSDLPGSDARRRVAIERFKPCANHHDSGDMPKYLPVGLTQYVLNIVSKKSPPYHVTQDDVSTPLQRLEVDQITGHQSVRGRGGVIAVYTRRIGRDSPNLPGSGKWTSTSPAPINCVVEPEPKPAPPKQPPLSPNADRGGTTRALSTSPAPINCVVEPEPRTSTAKTTASTAECGSGRHNASSPATTGNVS